MLQLDITGTLGKVITPSLGIPEQEFSLMRQTMKHHMEDFLRERAEGRHTWTQAPYDKEVLMQTQELARKFRKENIETVLWVGIGGSSLGPRVIKEVFESVETPELVVLDTIDPAILLEELKIIRWEHTLLVIASKSGGTLEPMSLFFLLLDRLREALPEHAAEHVVIITDPQEGLLREIAVREGYATLPIAPDIGGRYSIFTPIGLFPLALLGADTTAFIRGAKEMDTVCQSNDLDANPAALLASVQFLLDVRRNYPIRVIMPYATRLQSFGRWAQQLIAESLGKSEACGPVALSSIGTQDQHSMLQQWMQGRRLHFHLFIREGEKPRLSLPEVAEPSLSYLSGKAMSQLLDAAAEGTAQALTSAKRPHATITLPRLDAYHLGQLFFLCMVEVVLLGKLYRIDPYGQPGVEIGKKIAKDILSRGSVV